MTQVVILEMANTAPATVDNPGVILSRIEDHQVESFQSTLFPIAFPAKAGKHPDFIKYLPIPEDYWGLPTSVEDGHVFPVAAPTPEPQTEPEPALRTTAEVLAKANALADESIRSKTADYPSLVVQLLWPALTDDITGTGDRATLTGAAIADAKITPAEFYAKSEQEQTDLVDAFESGKVRPKRIEFAYHAQRCRDVAKDVAALYAAAPSAEFDVSAEFDALMNPEA